MSVHYEVEGGVATITIARPEVLNAMNADVFQGLTDAAANAKADPAVRAVVVTGEGRAFSSGLDTSLFSSQIGSVVDIPTLQRAFTAFEDLPKPTIAAVRGPCLGAGLQLAIACDLRVIADDANISAFEVKWGIIPDLGATQRLPRLIGLGRAKEMILTARSVSGAEAFAWGLANRLVAPDQTAKEAISWAGELAAGPPLALAAAKRLAGQAFDVPIATGLAREAAAQGRMLASEDFLEAVTAGMQKRPPEYKGR